MTYRYERAVAGFRKPKDTFSDGSVETLRQMRLEGKSVSYCAKALRTRVDYVFDKVKELGI